jgi:UDP-N-acetylglucosamine--N-acetylmuramyl-(pentapeptide) pyrophosphoryl-undecaprenol N-acetylglucosamine transferase
MKIGIIGGHLAPALAIIEQFPDSVEVVYFGRKYAMEGDSALSLEYITMHSRGVHFVEFISGRLQRTFTPHTFASLKKIPQSFSRARHLLKQENVNVVVGFGGYLSVPLCLSAKFLGIPIVIHEQTLGAGLANRIIAPFANKVCLSWEQSRKFFPKKNTVLTGDPLDSSVSKRPSFLAGYSRQRPLIVIVGGSQGAHAVNLLVEEVLESLLEQYDIIHQTGDAKQFADYDRLVSKRNNLSSALRKRYTVEKFIDPKEIKTVYMMADLVVGRAGINTVVNLLILNKPALLIPITVATATTPLEF